MISSEGVQNEGNGCPKWVCCSAVRAGRKGSEYLSRSESATPGSAQGCPKWEEPANAGVDKRDKRDKRDKLKVKAVKQDNIMLKDYPKYRSGCLK